MNWLKKRLKSKTIWLTSIAPSVLAFMTMYSSELEELMKGNYQIVFIIIGALAWYSRETTDKHLDDK